jgi:hypothetical protein
MGERLSRHVVGLEETDQTQVALVGGKGAHLGELSRVNRIRVPAGFCVTTEAFHRTMAEAPSLPARLDTPSRVEPDDRDAIRTISAEVRQTILTAREPVVERLTIKWSDFAAERDRLLSLVDDAVWADGALTVKIVQLDLSRWKSCVRENVAMDKERISAVKAELRRIQRGREGTDGKGDDRAFHEGMLSPEQDELLAQRQRDRRAKASPGA